MDTYDTIAAIATAASGAARGMIRISGPSVLDCLSKCFVANEHKQSLAAISAPSVVEGSIHLGDRSAKILRPVPLA